MGANAEVFVFEHETYITKVLPAFLKLLRDGHVCDWLRPFVERRQMQPELWDRTDLKRFCTYLERDFSWRGPYDLSDTYGLKWDERSCKSEDCPEREHCPFHRSGSETIAEQVNWLFKIAVSIKCLGPSQFVGRSKTVSYYWELLAGLGVGQDDPVVNLLACLGKRGFVIGYQWGFGFEGINGWLDPTETAELATRLDVLPLPRYESSFEAMERLRMPEADGGYEYQGFSFEALSLSFVRTVASIAARERRGLLWGNGLMPSQYYLDVME